MPETIAARDFRLANNSTPPVELGWTLDRDGKVVSNGCSCVWSGYVSYPHATGFWTRTGCKVHGGRHNE